MVAAGRSAQVGLVAAGLDVVAVGIEDERAEVVRMVERADAGAAVVLAASVLTNRAPLSLQTVGIAWRLSRTGAIIKSIKVDLSIGLNVYVGRTTKIRVVDRAVLEV